MIQGIIYSDFVFQLLFAKVTLKIIKNHRPNHLQITRFLEEKTTNISSPTPRILETSHPCK
jgi:hypothetical protein